MDWGALAKKLIAAGAPSIGAALGGPFGRMAGELLAKLLGVDPTPEAVGERIERMPGETVERLETDFNARWEAVARAFEASATADAAEARAAADSVREVNQTIRETAQGDGLLGKWRGFHAWEFTIECPLWFLLIAYSVIFDKDAFNAMANAQGFLSLYFGARGAVMGVHVFQGSKERQTSLRELVAVART